MSHPHREPAPEGVEIGPVAQHLLLENEDVKIWQVDTPSQETFGHHYHDYDYVLFYTSDMLGAVYHANEEHDRVWRSRLESGETLDESLGGWCYEHGVNFIPGSGFLSPGYANLSEHAFTAALIEIKRPRRPDQEGVGFSRSDALVGLPPRPGTTMLLENDRVRVFETVLAPGEQSERRTPIDTAVYVIDGGPVRATQKDSERGEVTHDDVRPSASGVWLAGGQQHRVENRGPTAYHELSVELK